MSEICTDCRLPVPDHRVVWLSAYGDPESYPYCARCAAPDTAERARDEADERRLQAKRDQ
jgi:hypothetical protein